MLPTSPLSGILLRTKFLAINVPLVMLAMIVLFAFFEVNANRAAYRKLDTKLDELIEIQSLLAKTDSGTQA